MLTFCVWWWFCPWKCFFGCPLLTKLCCVSPQLRLKRPQTLKAKLSLPQRPWCGGWLRLRATWITTRSGEILPELLTCQIALINRIFMITIKYKALLQRYIALNMKCCLVRLSFKPFNLPAAKCWILAVSSLSRAQGEVLEDSRRQWGRGPDCVCAQQGKPHQAGGDEGKLQLLCWGSGLQLCWIRAGQRAPADPHQESSYVVLTKRKQDVSQRCMSAGFTMRLCFNYCPFSCCCLPAPSQAPTITGKRYKGQTINISWKNVQPLPNEASIDGYKVSTV